MKDVAAERQFGANDTLASLRASFAVFFGRHVEAVALYTPDGTPVCLNAAAEDLRERVHFHDIQAGTLAREAFATALAGTIAAYEAHVRSNEGPMHLRVDVTPVGEDGNVMGVLEIVREPRVALTVDAGIDQLTGLPSAAVLYDRMARLLLHMRRDSRSFALHLFSVAAESVDDEAFVLELRRISAKRFHAALRQIDTVALLGRAFVVVQSNVKDLQSTKRLLERLIDELREPIAWNGRLYMPVVCCGSAVATRNTASIDELFVEADLALARVRGSRILGKSPALKYSQAERDKAQDERHAKDNA